MAWLFWPAPMAAMSRAGRYLLSEVAVLARIGGRYEPYIDRKVPYGVAVLARAGGRYEPCWPLFAVWRGGSGPYRRPP